MDTFWTPDKNEHFSFPVAKNQGLSYTCAERSNMKTLLRILAGSLALLVLALQSASADKLCPSDDVQCLINALEDETTRPTAIGHLRDLATIRINGKLRETQVPLVSAIPKLEKALRDPKLYVRQSAAGALLAIDPNSQKAIDELRRALERPLEYAGIPEQVPQVYQAAAHGLQRASELDSRTEGLLFSILTSTDDVGRVQLAASSALIATGDRDVRITDALRSCMKSPHPGVQSAAISELRKLGPAAASAVPDLAEFVRSATDQNLKLGAAVTLAELHSISAPAIPAFLEAINRLENAPQHNLESTMLMAELVKIGIPESDKAALTLELDRFGLRLGTLAILHQRDALFEELLDKRPGLIKEFDPLSQTLLHRAADLGRVNYVKLLLQRGADPNAQRSGFGTPLSAAAGRDQAEIIMMLRKAGADPSISGLNGTPLEFARKLKKHRAIEALTASLE